MRDRLEHAYDEITRPPLGITDPAAFAAQVGETDLIEADDATLFRLLRDRDPSLDGIAEPNRAIEAAFRHAGLESYFEPPKTRSASRSALPAKSMQVGLILAVVAVALIYLWQAVTGR